MFQIIFISPTGRIRGRGDHQGVHHQEQSAPAGVQVREFGQWITGENWEALRGDCSASEQAQILKDMTKQQVDNYFPVTECPVSAKYKPWITKDIKKLDQ